MADEDEETLKFHQRTSVHSVVTLVVLLLLIPPILAEWMNNRPVRSRNAKLTRYLMIGVITFNTLSHLLWIGRWLGCVNCGLLVGFMFTSKAVVKGINMAFLIHRAKLVQGMSPVLSKKCFEKILPAIVAGIVFIYIAGIIKSLTNPDLVWICVQGNDWKSIQFCSSEKTEDNQSNDDARGGTALAIAIDLVITTFLMILFVVPLYRVNHNDLGVMNDNQVRQRRKLKRLLIWSVLLTFISNVTSTMSLLLIVYPADVTYVLFVIGISDPAINIWTLWFMITRNRQYFQDICCRYRRKKALNRQQSVALTDIPSRLKSASLPSRPNDIQISRSPELIIEPDPDLQICN